MTNLPLFCLIITALCSRALGRSWLAPGAFFSAFWAGIVISGAVGAPDFATPWTGPAWIALACVALSAGSTLGEVDLEGGDRTQARDILDKVHDGLPIAIAACVVLGIAYLISRVAIIGPVWSFNEDDPDLSSWFQVLLASHYAGPAFGGLYFASGRKRARLISLLSLIAPALTALVYLRRSWLLMSGMFFVGGIFTAWVRAHREPVQLVTLRRLGVGGLVIAGLAGIAILFQAFRLQLTGTEASVSETASAYSDAMGSDSFEEAWTRVRVILFGYVVPFSNWMDRAWDKPPEPTWGVWTFSGPFRILGYGSLSRIDDFELQSGALSNLYTAFHGLITDFSPMGALVFMFGFGLVSGWAYRAVSRGHAMAMPILIGFYASTIFSPLWSLFRYNALVGGLVYVGIFVARGEFKRERVKVAPSSPTSEVESWTGD